MTIQYTVTDKIARLEIFRPEKRNTLDNVTLGEFIERINEAVAAQDVRVLFICAQEGLFSAGEDLNDYLSASKLDDNAPAARLLAALKGCPKPIVTCIQGPAVGFAVTLLSYCDLAYAGEHALFSLPYTALGLTPHYGMSFSVILGAGYHKAAEKLLLSEPISATEALQMRLINGIFPDEAVYAQAWARAKRLTQLSQPAVKETKRLLRAVWNTQAQEISQLEHSAFETVASTEEAKEACRAFLEGRKPSFEK